MKKQILSVTLFLVASLTFSAEIVKSSAELERKADKMYSSKDNVLYYLDSGMLNYYEGNYSAAIEKLSEAENFISEYYTKSISQNTAAIFTNDSVIEYPGEDYEDIYLNLFKALAYYKAGKWEEGFHEINAYKRKAGAVAQRHAGELLTARQAAKMGDTSSVNISFHDSALGEYLFMLYYRSIRDSNQVQYAARMLKDVFRTSSDIYDFKIPSSVDEEINVNYSDARLNFVVFSGVSPYKTEDVKVYSKELALSLPELVIPKNEVKYVSVRAINKATGKSYVQNLEQIENFGNICADVYKSRSKVIYYKSVARSMTKGSVSAGTKVAGDVLSDSDNVLMSVFGTVLSSGSEFTENANYESEHADLRHSNYFPGRADVGGITLEPGIYDVTVAYFKEPGGNSIYSEHYESIKVEKGKLNLVTAASTPEEVQNSKRKITEKKEKYPGVAVSNSSERITVYDSDSINEGQLYFDIGSEPEADTSMTFGMVQYNWNDILASNIKLIYKSTTSTEDEIGHFVNPVEVTKEKEFELDFLPVIYKFGSNQQFNVSFGMSYQYLNEKMNAGMFDSTDENEMMFDPDGSDAGKYFMVDSKRTAHIIAPRIGFNAQLPVYDIINFKFEVYTNPVYLMVLNQNMRYHSNQTDENFDYSGDNSFSKISSPYYDIKISAELFNYLRVVSQFSSQTLQMQQMSWSVPDYDSLTGYDDTQKINKLRFGLEILAGNKNRSRVRGGIYYQNEWNDSSFTGVTEHKSKWILGIGSER